MTPSVLWGLLALAGCLGLVVFNLKQRRKLRQLERLLESTHAKLEQLQLHFSRFAPDDVVEHLSQPGGEVKASRRTVTVLFADLKGFTALCERLDPERMVPILNGYFKVMTQAITEHHGRVTELTGDGLLALFGALEPNPWQAQDAVLGALAMRQALARYNDTLRVRALPELEIGIGIHRGEVLAGVMGNEELSKFGVVGDAINVASRVQEITREFGVDLLVTQEVRGELDARFQLREMPGHMVKGKLEPIRTFVVDGVEASAQPALGQHSPA